MADRPLRLAFLGDPNSPHLQRWLAFFVDRGHEVHLLVPAHDVVTTMPGPGVHVHRFRAWPRLPIRGLGSLITARALRMALRAIRPDVLHAHFLGRYGLAGWLAGFHPWVLTVWGSDVLIVLPGQAWLRLRGRLALRAADLVTAGSEHMVRAAIAAGARADRTRLVQFGVDTRRFAPGPDPTALRRRLDLEGKRVVLSNRTIAPLYRQPVVLEALARLPSDVAVLMTRRSARPSELEAIQRRAAELGIADRVRIAPEIADAEMPDLYRLAEVTVSVPASDGGPVSLLEALAVGRPVVATDLPPVREWLAELDPEALVPVDDPTATARAIKTMLERQPGDRAAHAARGREAVMAKADYASSMTRMESLYRALADGRAIP